MAKESSTLPEAHNAKVRPPSPSTPRVVMVVEDDDDMRELLKRILQRAGFATRVASNGKEALQRLDKESVHLVVTDMVMPDMDGVELIRVLQTTKPDLPVVALSGFDEFVGYLKIATQFGARVALRKPVTPKALIGAVNHALDTESVFTDHQSQAETNPR